MSCLQGPWWQTAWQLEATAFLPPVITQAADLTRQSSPGGGLCRLAGSWEHLSANRPTHKCSLSDCPVPSLVPGNCCDNTLGESQHSLTFCMGRIHRKRSFFLEAVENLMTAIPWACKTPLTFSKHRQHLLLHEQAVFNSARVLTQ